MGHSINCLCNPHGGSMNTATQRTKIIQCLSKGKWVSPLDALRQAGTMKLSTRVGELRAEGFLILDKWHESKEYKLYKMVKE